MTDELEISVFVDKFFGIFIPKPKPFQKFSLTTFPNVLDTSFTLTFPTSSKNVERHVQRVRCRYIFASTIFQWFVAVTVVPGTVENHGISRVRQ